MNILHTHTGDFTPAETAWAIANDRVFTHDDPALMDADYPYLVLAFPHSRSYRVMDAWSVNALGQKHPEKPTAFPVLMAEVSSIDFAAPPLRQALLNFSRLGQQSPSFIEPQDLYQATRTGRLWRGNDESPAPYIVVDSADGNGGGQPIDHRGAKLGPFLAQLPQGVYTATKVAEMPTDVVRHLRAPVKTFIFGLSPDAHWNLALGVGRDQDEARADAIDRMRVRNPAAKADASAEAGPERLLHLLTVGGASVVHCMPGQYQSQQQLGHNYMSLETHVVAEILSSDSRVSELLSGKPVTPARVLNLLQSRLRKIFHEHEFNPVMVDLAEVAESLEPEASRLVDNPPAVVAIDGGRKIVKPQDFGYFPTPPELAERVLALADIKPGMKVIEPAPAEVSPQLVAVQSGRKIDQDVLSVLSRCEVEGKLVRLPDGRLEAKLYKKVDEVLRTLGGKWIGRKVMAHQFDEDPQAALDVAVGTGTFVKPQDFGYFPTPPELVERVLALADIEPGMKVLEPSAGQGAFAIALARLVGNPDLVTVCELLPANAKKLREAGFSAVNQVDFLTVDPYPLYDRVIMNPPFGMGVDVDHVMHATKFLKPDGKLVAITSVSWESRETRKAQEFRAFVEQTEAQVQEVDHGAFKAAGTNVATRILSMDAENFPWNQQHRQTERQRAA